MADHRHELIRALGVAAFGVVLLNVLALVFANIWHAVAINHAIMLPLALWSLGERRREWLRGSLRKLMWGVAFGGALVLATVATLAAAKWLDPELHAWALQPMAMKDKIAPALGLALLVLPIIPGEEIVWRGAVMLPLADRWGKAAGVIVAALLFAAAHLTLGSVPLLAAAVALGAFWGIVTLWTRSLVPALLCHLIWDVMLLYVVPL
jgi:membrane protease YdiL (CAAX protease family)